MATDAETPPATDDLVGALAIVVSDADEASVHIGEQLRQVLEWETVVDDERPDARGGGTVYRRDGVVIREFEDLHLDLDSVAAAFDDPRLVVFASRHAGETGPLLTAHHTGNFGAAEFGGSDRSLARAAPAAHRAVVRALSAHAPAGYEVGMECTHHGPTDVGAPSLFVEVGSGPEQWDDADAARAVARAILDLVDVPADAPVETDHRRHLVGFGGGHYAPRFERVIRETDWAVGHVAADWGLEDLGESAAATDLLVECFSQSAAHYALLEADRSALADAIEALDRRVVDETWVRETEGVPLGLVERLEAAVERVDEGLRFGALVLSVDPGAPLQLARIPAALLDAANAVDRGATLDAVDGASVAYATGDSGTLATDEVVIPAGRDRSTGERPSTDAPLVTALASVLREGYESVEQRDGTIVVERTEFDPDAAQAAGVEPGPDFGRLAEGESVTVDGETVTPADVTVERETTLPATLERIDAIGAD